MNLKYRLKMFLKRARLWNLLWDGKEFFLTRRKLAAFRQEATRLRAASRQAAGSQALARLIGESKIFTSQQNPGEIVPLLDLLRERQPRVVCEIGSAGGGTLFLFARASHPQARLLSIDLKYPTKAHRLAFPDLVGEQQRLTLIEASSQDPATLARVKQWLGDERIDFLFIDGDHSYQGVAQDFALYAPLVQPGGIIAFHDIHPDHFLRYGEKTYASSGKVPFFWRDLLRMRDFRYQEWIESPDQDGRGIGVLLLPPRAAGE
jgi:cephalosporin hydroxylase